MGGGGQIHPQELQNITNILQYYSTVLILLDFYSFGVYLTMQKKKIHFIMYLFLFGIIENNNFNSSIVHYCTISLPSYCTSRYCTAGQQWRQHGAVQTCIVLHVHYSTVILQYCSTAGPWVYLSPAAILCYSMGPSK